MPNELMASQGGKETAASSTDLPKKEVRAPIHEKSDELIRCLMPPSSLDALTIVAASPEQRDLRASGAKWRRVTRSNSFLEKSRGPILTPPLDGGLADDPAQTPPTPTKRAGLMLESHSIIVRVSSRKTV